MAENLDDEELRWRQHAQERQAIRQQRQQQRLRKQRIKTVSVAAVMAVVIIALILVQKGRVTPSPEKEGLAAAGTEVVADFHTENRTGYDGESIDYANYENGDGQEADSETAASLENTEGSGVETPPDSGTETLTDGSGENFSFYQYTTTENTLHLGSEINSNNAIFIDMETGAILADKGAKERIAPASMTKVLTLLVAVENIDNLDDTFQITSDITDYSFVNGCSNAGFEKEEVVTIRDLLYGTNLPSGADAALGLATYVAGSQDAFVDLMNRKLEELGLSESAHFTNCIGIYDENHYCTVYDMAVIMNAAINNETCREVMSAHTYHTSVTTQHPEGILLSNWFLRRIEDKDTGGEIICGKTGYVNESGSCAVSYGTDEKGRSYICVTVNAQGKWKCIYDHVDLYKKFSER